MTKVEELRSELNGLIGDIVGQMPLNAYGNPDDTIPPIIDSLISAAKEEERNRIWNQGEAIMIDADGNPKFYIVSADNFIPLDEQTHDGRNR